MYIYIYPFDIGEEKNRSFLQTISMKKGLGLKDRTSKLSEGEGCGAAIGANRRRQELAGKPRRRGGRNRKRGRVDVDDDQGVSEGDDQGGGALGRPRSGWTDTWICPICHRNSTFGFFDVVERLVWLILVFFVFWAAHTFPGHEHF